MSIFLTLCLSFCDLVHCYYYAIIMKKKQQLLSYCKQNRNVIQNSKAHGKYTYISIYMPSSLSRVWRYQKGKSSSLSRVWRYQKGKSSSLSRVWRYQKGNYNPFIEEEHIIQWPKEKGKSTNNDLQNITQKPKARATRIPLKAAN